MSGNGDSKFRRPQHEAWSRSNETHSGRRLVITGALSLLSVWLVLLGAFFAWRADYNRRVRSGTESIPQVLTPLMDQVPAHVPSELWHKAVADTQVMLVHLVRSGALSREQMEVLRIELDQQARAASRETAILVLIQIWTNIETKAKPILAGTQYPQLLAPALAARDLLAKRPTAVGIPAWRAAVNRLFELLTRLAGSGQLSPRKLDALSEKILEEASRTDPERSAQTLSAIWSEASSYLSTDCIPPQPELPQPGESAHPT
jgi:hypothetical protein